MFPIFIVSGPEKLRANFFSKTQNFLESRGSCAVIIKEVKDKQNHNLGKSVISGPKWQLFHNEIPFPPSIGALRKLLVFIPTSVEVFFIDVEESSSQSKEKLFLYKLNNANNFINEEIEAIIGSTDITASDKPYFKLSNIEKFFLWLDKNSTQFEIAPDFMLWVNDGRIGCKEFIQNLFIAVINGILQVLKKTGNAKTIQILMRNRENIT